MIKIFNVLGNERPGILVKIEDCILEAIIALSEGQLRENAINDLYSKIMVLEHDLCKDESALTWFNFPTSSRIPSTPPLSGLPVTPSSGLSNLFNSFHLLTVNEGFPNLHTDMIQGKWSILKSGDQPQFSHCRSTFISAGVKSLLSHCARRVTLSFSGRQTFSSSICQPSRHFNPFFGRYFESERWRAGWCGA